MVLHRKNALFYRTENGAAVGNLFLSLIQTAVLNRVDPFDYLVALLRHAEAMGMAPMQWMPRNFQERMAVDKPST